MRCRLDLLDALVYLEVSAYAYSEQQGVHHPDRKLDDLCPVLFVSDVLQPGMSRRLLSPTQVLRVTRSKTGDILRCAASCWRKRLRPDDGRVVWPSQLARRQGASAGA